METNQWRSKKKIESPAETLQASSRKSRGQARMVPPGNGVSSRPERARKSLNEKLDTVALNTLKKDVPVNLYGEKGLVDEIFLEDEEMGLETGLGDGESSPFCGVSDKLLQRIELLGRDHESKRLDNSTFRSTETMRKRQESSAVDELVEMTTKIQSLAAENSQLKKSLAAKEELAVSLQERKFQVESEFETLMTRLDSTEKENAFLRYEYTVLEKDLEAKTEETEHTRKSMELTHKQQLRNVNKIVELEAECQRLRLQFRKKFPERSISMRNEGEEKKMEMRRRSANKSDLMMRDEAQNRKLKYDLLMEQIGNVRAENKNLMDIIMKKNMEIKDLSRGQKPLDASSFDIRSENSVMSPSGSKEMMLLMDDFNEMEKLAIVCTEKKPRVGDEKEGSFDWIQVVLSAITKQERISKRGVKELLQDIKIALGCMDENDSAVRKNGEDDPLCITWKSTSESGSMTKDEIKRHLSLRKADEVKKIECDELRCKLEESQEKIKNLEAEIKSLRESKEKVEAELETEKSMKDDLDTKLNITRANLNETQKKLSSLEDELDYRKSCCEELEGTCIELQLQLQSVETKKPTHRNKNGWDRASVKLSECQETITNLRKQLRALSTTETSRENSSSYKGEDDTTKRVAPHDDDDGAGNHYNALIVYEPVKAKGEMVPRKKQGLGFLKKMLFRMKRVSSKKCLALTM
ncbi:PREDICTED: filament-like plant protein 7 [Camelina sativa]|uniref:Filament-like plant protein 7 n=1 Tax=Camelina sativa TaxID=90675 RepID=A0ABM0XLX2_CAMSA|nr:PREDICTED: filament-like plant protein 7 [Camelina sativa]XP_010487877.1 PREDICTED: filament-like plant protein 7 [Camelina sativa]